eukprot:CAMPEP_0119328348 /NCGR_PEP_ID=MMETSP1333-20130426/73107_1 /TAXON_ID=418940 /ORGANISM="Scyphosphaera apsteinii, Strain RCC1455" /LENGTH=206 /DNA_ID=CAMNT_0007337171 /DNA_START=51 /DNA_END=667 /DNA_ORIENTATION=-
MWVATGPTPEDCVQQIDDVEFLNSNLRVFSGEATDERDKLSLVPSLLGLYAELYAIALNERNGSLASSGTSIGALPAQMSSITPNQNREEECTETATNPAPLKKSKTIAHISLQAVTNDVRKQLDILDLIHESQEEIFPQSINIRPPPWAPVPRIEHTRELFGPLVNMVKTRLQSDAALCTKLVVHAMQRKAATMEAKLLTVQRLA